MTDKFQTNPSVVLEILRVKAQSDPTLALHLEAAMWESVARTQAQSLNGEVEVLEDEPAQ